MPIISVWAVGNALCSCTYMLVCYTAPHIIFSYPIVHIAVGEHGVEVLYTFKCLPVIVVLKTLLNSAQIHRTCNNCIIILKDNKDTGINTPKSFLRWMHLILGSNTEIL